MNRRIFGIRAILAALTSSCPCSRLAMGNPSVNGCRTLGFWASAYRDRILRSSGRTILLDDIVGRIGDTLSQVTGVRPGICFYDDSLEGANALAMPDALLPGAPDGTVMLGLELLKHELGYDEFERLPKNSWQSSELRSEVPFPRDNLPEQSLGIQAKVAVIMAHEYGHIKQYKSGMPPDGPWQMELHADFMAGWFIRSRYIKGEYMLERELQNATKSIFEKGDTLFNDPRHHGTPELRAKMVQAGYDAGKLSWEAAFNEGRVKAGL